MSRLLWGALAGAAVAYCMMRPARVRVEAALDVEPDALLERVAEVEREPELIPFVQRVRVEERRGDSVSYRVDVSVAGIPGWARFLKRFPPGEGRAAWETLDGVIGFRQNGSLTCRREDGRARAVVETETRFDVPLLGPALAHLSRPVLAYAFSKWLEILGEAAKASHLQPFSAASERDRW